MEKFNDLIKLFCIMYLTCWIENNIILTKIKKFYIDLAYEINNNLICSNKIAIHYYF